MKLTAGVDQEHHAVIGEGGDGEEHDEAHEPSCALEGVWESEDAGTNDGDEDVGEGLGLGGERREVFVGVLATQERRVFFCSCSP